MKNNGFTLIELIMVILILGVIAIITVPTVNSIIRDSKQKAYDNQIKLIEDTTRTYMSKNSMELPSQSDGSSVCITVDNLKRKGFLSKDDIINPNYKENSTKYLQRRVNRPGILLEAGFLSNANERYLLQKQSYQDKIAEVVRKSVVKYYDS